MAQSFSDPPSFSKLALFSSRPCSTFSESSKVWVTPDVSTVGDIWGTEKIGKDTINHVKQQNYTQYHLPELPPSLQLFVVCLRAFGSSVLPLWSNSETAVLCVRRPERKGLFCFHPVVKRL
jgi:hypothetical protein